MTDVVQNIGIEGRATPMDVAVYDLVEFLNLPPAQKSAMEETKPLKIIYISKGKGNVGFDGLTYPVEANSVVLLLPGKGADLEAGGRLEGTVFLLYRLFFKQEYGNISNTLQPMLFYSAIESPCYALAPNHFALMKDSCEALKQECSLDDGVLLHRDVIHQEVLLMLLLIARSLPKLSSFVDLRNHDVRTWVNFCYLIDVHFQDRWNVEQYAAQLGVSPRKLSQLVRDLANTSPLKVINNRITSEAKRLLQYSDLTLSEIAVRLGNMDTSNFTKFFRANSGMSPNEYRNKVRG